MLQSMTGYGSAEVTTQSHHIKVEVRTLNSKFLDVNLRLPRELSDKELEIRNLISEHLKRGKISFVVEVTTRNDSQPTVHVNEALFRTYYEKYAELAKSTGADPNELFKLALQSPEVICNDSSTEISEWEAVKQTFVTAMDRCNEFRLQEGLALSNKLGQYINIIREGLEEVKAQDPERIRQIKERIKNNIDEIRDKVQMDENRFEQELIYYIEKIDITEEKVRLASHLDYFMEVMSTNDSQGKKLGFISQEIGREINTIGAKANDVVMQRAVVQMKDELEKIKEQSMNLL